MNNFNGHIMHRYNWIDWARVFVIYLVILGHLLDADIEDEYFMHSLIYSFHMPFFFFLSGLLAKHKEKKIREVVIQGIKSLYVPYITFYVITVVLLIPTYILSKKFPWETLFYFLTADGHGEAGPCWFLVCLLEVRIVSYFLFKIKFQYQSIILLLCMIVAYTFPYSFWFRVDTLFMVLPFYVVGFYCKRLMKSENSIPFLSLLTCISAFLLFFLVQANGDSNVYTRDFGQFAILYYPIAFIGIVFVCCISMLFANLSSRLLVVLSTGTIVIMGLHGIVGFYWFMIVKYFMPVFSMRNIESKMIHSGIVLLLLIYPIILLQKHYPTLIGNRSFNGTNK